MKRRNNESQQDNLAGCLVESWKHISFHLHHIDTTAALKQNQRLLHGFQRVDLFYFFTCVFRFRVSSARCTRAAAL